MLLAREEGNEKQPKMRGRGGGAVLKGMPLLKCRVIPRRALPFPARKGRGRGVGGRSPGSRPAGCGSEFQPRSGAGRGQALAFGPAASRPHPCTFPRGWENCTFLEGWDLVPGGRTFISDSQRSETDGLLCAWRVGGRVGGAHMRTSELCCRPPLAGPRSRQVPAGGSGTGLGPSRMGSMALSMCALGARE